jgi:TetR/AcrR family transcriptional regulator, transcriptional repressor of aconitase
MTHCSVESGVTRVTQEHVDARRDSILGAAAQLFARKGISGATMAEIANEADLSAGAIYRYFKSKEDLVRAVFDDASVRNHHLFHGAADTATSPMHALELVGRKVWVELDDRDALICDIQMTLAAEHDPDDFAGDLHKTRSEVRQLLLEMVRQAQAAGEIEPSVNAEHLTIILQACTAGIQMLKLAPDDEFDLEATFNLFVRMVRGLRPCTGEEQGS